MEMPFYHAVINGTEVTITGKGQAGGGYYEKYQGDNNLFNLAFSNSYNNNGNETYQNELIESYDGKETGEYQINPIGNTGNSKGVFITNPTTDHSEIFYITLTGSLSPQ